MTSYEIVRRAVEFDTPERIPIRFGSMGIDDTYGVGIGSAAGWAPSEPCADEWGCVWHYPPQDSGITNMGQPKGHPLKNWDLIDEINFPGPDDDNRYAHIEEALKGAGDKYVVVGCGFTYFERMHYLRGFVELLADMHVYPEKVQDLAERVLAFPVGVARNIGKRFKGRIHGMCMTDDWGTQQASIVSIPMWREFFKSGYTRLFGAIHDAGMHAWMHSCGHVNEVVGEWIECGLDVVNLQQPTNLGIEEMGEEYQGRICFESLCDIQATLPFKSDDEIRAEVALLLKHWATPQGGFVLGDYGDGAAIGVPLDKKRIMLQAFVDLAAPGLEIPA